MSHRSNTFYASLADQLTQGATRASLGLLGLRSESLREHLRALFGSTPGTNHSFLADPVFEATFGWEPAEAPLGGLADDLLHPKLIQALGNPPAKNQRGQRVSLAEDYKFPSSQAPYRHQLQAWQALNDPEAVRSVLVSSGTGSGKTECFLVPILNDLARQLDHHPGTLSGVRAIFLYPLNALIKSQRDRLTAWTEPFDGRLRFCLYNGDTPPRSPAPRSREWRCEVVGRDELRDDPPPILVTNATMLEYMLVRAEDRPIIEHSRDTLSWIVIDEAHNYIGSQAAELTLLLRRVLHAFGKKPGEVRFVATSATIGDFSTEEEARKTRQRLADFLADIAGVSPEQITVVVGGRKVPELSEKLVEQNRSRPPLEQLHGLSSEQCFEALAADPSIRQMRASLVARAHTLGEVSRLLVDGDSAQQRRTTLETLDLCAQSTSSQGEPLLPLRGHLFQRAQNGLWACSNSRCGGREGHLEKGDWAFGKLFLERRTHCDESDCGWPVFELVQCGECGAEYLAANEALPTDELPYDHLIPRVFNRDEDEFQLDLEPLDDEAEDDEEAVSHAVTNRPRLLSKARQSTIADHKPIAAGLGRDGRLEIPAAEGCSVQIVMEGSDRSLRCPECGEAEHPGKPHFRPVRLGAPFLLQTAVPTVLRHLPKMKKTGDPLPFDGRRLISFTDSRQGTARFAAKLQLDTERDYVRSVLYHAVADRSRSTGEVDCEGLRSEIVKLEQAVQENPSLEGLLKNTLDEKREQLSACLNPPPASLKWSQAVDRLMGEDTFTRWLMPTLKGQTFGLLSERQLAELCLWREFLLRPRRQFSLEGLGLLCLRYPGLAQLRAPAAAKRHKITDAEWRELVQVALDFDIRSGRAVDIPQDVRRWLGYPGVITSQLSPGAMKSPPKNPFQRTWPSTDSPFFKRRRLVRIVAFLLGVDWNSDTRWGQDEQAEVEELLVELWRSVKQLMGKRPQGQFKLELPNQAEVVQIQEAWLCPVTRRLLPVAVRGITPYLPESLKPELSRCTQKVTLPRLPTAFPVMDASGRTEIDDWLEQDAHILKLRRLGVWTDLNDRIARFSPYFRAVEHSAQIDGSLLTDREGRFKEGKLNLLSCSTTMEMGVDIGGLTAVAMNNVPPHPANFLQRAGRAGRRGERTALSFTLCKSTPHGEAVFRNPLWPFTTRLAVPRVSLQSEPIVQRHIQALLLARFFIEGAPGDIPRLNAGWFFEEESGDVSRSAPWERFCEWCMDGALSDDASLNGIRSLSKRTLLAGLPEGLVVQGVVNGIERVAEAWRQELHALLEDRKQVATPKGDGRAEQAIDRQLERMRNEYLLSELANRGFLPGYGFPTGVVPLITTTVESLQQKARARSERVEGDRYRRSGYPSRDLALAIRDYAPTRRGPILCWMGVSIAAAA